MPMQTPQVPSAFGLRCHAVGVRGYEEPLRLKWLNANASPHLLRSVPKEMREASTVALSGTSPLPSTSFAQRATVLQPGVAQELCSGQGLSASRRRCNPYV